MHGRDVKGSPLLESVLTQQTLKYLAHPHKGKRNLAQRRQTLSYIKDKDGGGADPQFIAVLAFQDSHTKHCAILHYEFSIKAFIFCVYFSSITCIR